MTTRWTAQQQAAITLRGSNLLVSAAAGAGKTAVLVERVVRWVTGPDLPPGGAGASPSPPGAVTSPSPPGAGASPSPPGAVTSPAFEPIERLLVLTYTEAAALEMKERVGRAIRLRLEELEKAAGGPEASAELSRRAAQLRRQAVLLGRASVSTIHSFCHSICRRYFHRLGLGPGFEVLSEEEAELLRSEVIADLFEELYDRADPGFLGLVEAYAGDRDDGKLAELVLRLHAYSRSHPDPEGWLSSAAAVFEAPPGRVAETPFGPVLVSDMGLALRRAAERIRLALGLASSIPAAAPYLPILAEERERLAAAAATLEDNPGWDVVRATLAEVSRFARLPSVRSDVLDEATRRAVRRYRDQAKRQAAELRAAWSDREEADLLGELRSLAGPMRALAGLVARFDAAYRGAKDDSGAVDFSDLEHFCLRALTATSEVGTIPVARSPSDVAGELRERYDEVLVDEYQDINDVQEAILRLVSRGDNLFMVGDIKQSIYRFRLARPELFAGKQAAYVPAVSGFPSEGEIDTTGTTPLSGGPGGSPLPGRLVSLPTNFRSRAQVTDVVNLLFRQIMWRASRAEIDYDHRAELLSGREDPPAQDGGAPAVELHLLELGPGPDPDPADEAGPTPEPVEGEQASGGSEDHEPLSASEPSLEDLQAIEREARVIAHRIQGMVDPDGARSSSGVDGGAATVFDPQAGAPRPARYGDVAVLMRATAYLANLVAGILTRHGIPSYAHLNTGYFQAVEVETVLALLRVIDNPRQDIPLAAVLRSPIVGLNEVDLARVRLTKRPGDFYDAVVVAAREPAESSALTATLASFLVRLEEWRTAARRGPLSRLIRRLYRETGYYAYAGGLPGGSQRQANLRNLQDRAGLFDQFTRQGLPRFLRFIDRLRETQGDIGPPPPLGEGEDAVRIMSIHQSKGLEFPIVFLAGLGRRFNLKDTTADLICHRELGFGPSVVDVRRRLKYPSLAKRAVVARVREEAVAEEMRILYVGLTRARDRLVLVGGRRDIDAGLAEWRLTGAEASRCPGAAGTRLPAAVTAGALSFLDWIGPALASGLGSHPWSTRIWRSRDLLDLDPPEIVRPGIVATDLTRVDTDRPDTPAWTVRLRRSAAALLPVEAVVPGAITVALNWRYPSLTLTTLPAKVTATELKRLGAFAPAHAEEAAPSSPSFREHDRPESRPRFLQALPGGLTPAERGRATHLVLQHADLAGPLDAGALTHLAVSLAEREFLTPEQAATVDAEDLARFFRSPLGRRLIAAGPRVRREVPFTITLPLHEVYGDREDTAGLSPADRSEPVLVQGMIDVLIDEPQGLTIMDFKTDRTAGDDLAARTEDYRSQIDLYRRAASRVWDRPVEEAWIVFLHPGTAVRI